MVLASTLVPGIKKLTTIFIMAVLGLMAYSCQSPIELDVHRSKVFTDGSVHPTRLSLYYYFGDSAYEAIVTDTAYLNTIWIERKTTRYQITIPRLEFSLPDTVVGTAKFSPFVRKFCFSSMKKSCDGLFTMAVSSNSWLSGEYYTRGGSWSPYVWQADTLGRQIRLAYIDIASERLIKASIQILVADPESPTYASYRALITMEY